MTRQWMLRRNIQYKARKEQYVSALSVTGTLPSHVTAVAFYNILHYLQEFRSTCKLLLSCVYAHMMIERRKVDCKNHIVL